MRIRRVTLFAGHYGSGKTNIAVNYALYLRSRPSRSPLEWSQKRNDRGA